MASFDISIIIVCILAFFIGYVIVSSLVKYFKKNRYNQQTHETENSKDERKFDRQNYHISLDKPWFEVLGVGPDASIEQIRNAYKKLIKQYHPDKLSNLAPELKNFAEMRTKELNQAYSEGVKKKRKRI
jgi:DnaJ like chaperone protein